MTPSFKKRPFRFALLPSMLAMSLALGACQDPSASSEKNLEATNINASEASNGGNVSSDTAANKTISDSANEISAEEQMIASLSSYRWTLISATDKDVQPLTMLMDVRDQVRLSFSQYQGQNTLIYSVGCNNISAMYQLKGATLTIKDSMSTKMACGNLNKAENNLNELMKDDSQLTLVKNGKSTDDGSIDDKPVLTQVMSDATTLVWQGRLTSQAKYNSKGETVFWAVNAKTIPCENDSSEMCLQVKPVTYDDQGIKSSEGKWAAFKGDIDGYQHDGKHDEVLRLQRYQLSTRETAEDTAAVDEEYAYVLDAVIESSIVK
ncbi:META domain-containing protein [Psychrobacter sp.]|uniref:META domain-containing protein n=1 Tax=Psychrobacter sp. TaxID=56811 RepID=UPI003BB0CD67